MNWNIVFVIYVEGKEGRFVDNLGREVKLKKLHELIHESEEIIRVFEMTERTIGQLLAEGIS